MEQLTPELERQLQVEELWARRIVLADNMNAQRRQRFYSQHTQLTQFGTVPNIVDIPEIASVAAVQNQIEAARTDLELTPARVVTASRPAAPVVQRSARKSRHPDLWRAVRPMAATILLLVSALAVMNLARSPRAQAMTYLSRLPAAPAQVAAALPVLPLVQHADLKAEVAARIATSLGSHANGPQVLQAMHSASERSGGVWN